MLIYGAVVVNDELYVYGVDYNVTDDDDHKSYLVKLDNSGTLEPIGDGVPNVELYGAVVVNDELYVYGKDYGVDYNVTDDDDDIKSYLAKLADGSLGSRLEPIGDGVPHVTLRDAIVVNDEDIDDDVNENVGKNVGADVGDDLFHSIKIPLIIIGISVVVLILIIIFYNLYRKHKK